MDISVIIVNYNVKDFLVQCLNSVHIALQGIDSEIIVIDNNSTDGSKEYFSDKYSDVHFDWLPNNIGFGAANNIGIQQSKGKYVLLLNPDTIVHELTLKHMLDYMNSHIDTGIAGCRVLNADGSFQIACRRGFPSPWASFCKLFGLQSLVPSSKLCAGYNLTYKSIYETYEVDALIGAFMFCRREVLEQIHGFDTDFFMYGEDLDLCYRAQLSGWKVTYVHEPTIIHFKGESTKRSSLNAIHVFYSSMEIFTKKHFNNSTLFLFFLRIGIWLRASFASAFYFAEQGLFMMGDILVVIASIMLATHIRFGNPFAFPEYAYPMVFLSSSLIALGCLLFAGAYFEYSGKLKPVLTGYFASFFILSSLTYFFKEYAFSRGILLMTIGFSLSFSVALRLLWHLYHTLFGNKSDKRIILLGTNAHEHEIVNALQSAESRNAIIVGRVTVNDENSYAHQLPVLGKADALKEIVYNQEADEIIMLDSSIDISDIIKYSSMFAGSKVRIHAVQEYDDIVVSRITNDISGISAAMPIINLQRLRYRLQKRLVDLCISLFFLSLGVPIVFLFSKHPISLLKKLFNVCKGDMSIIGLYQIDNSLPVLGKIGITGLVHISKPEILSAQAILNLNEHYIRYYTPTLDIEILIKHLLRIGLSGFKLRS